MGLLGRVLRSKTNAGVRKTGLGGGNSWHNGITTEISVTPQELWSRHAPSELRNGVRRFLSHTDHSLATGCTWNECVLGQGKSLQLRAIPSWELSAAGSPISWEGCLARESMLALNLPSTCPLFSDDSDHATLAHTGSTLSNSQAPHHVWCVASLISSS